jgi:hypothetical protein
MTKLRVLVACEFSGVVRRAFAELGHYAVSVDLLPAEDGSPNHYTGSIEDFFRRSLVEKKEWDLMIAHPPCTHLASSGARWFKDKLVEQENAITFVRDLMSSGLKRICIENPIGVLSTQIRKPDQIIQPWQFGHGETKATCLWLKNLPPLKPTKIVDGREARIHRMPPGPNRWKERSRTYDGIAKAMATQWSDHVLGEQT